MIFLIQKGINLIKGKNIYEIVVISNRYKRKIKNLLFTKEKEETEKNPLGKLKNEVTDEVKKKLKEEIKKKFNVDVEFREEDEEKKKEKEKLE